MFRLNRTFYQFDDQGRPSDDPNLSALRERVPPILIRRRKHCVETEWPGRNDHNHFVMLTPAMEADYDDGKSNTVPVVPLSHHPVFRRMGTERHMGTESLSHPVAGCCPTA